MALPTGLAAQLGFAEESTYGTAVTVTRFLPLVSESVKNTVARVESKGIIAGQQLLRSTQWATGTVGVAGDVNLELSDRSLGLLWKHSLGSVNTTGPVGSAYTHTYTPGDLTGKSLTLQVGRPMTTGTVQAFTYPGSKITDFELDCSAGDIATVKFGFVSQTETTATALATASYVSGITPLTFVGGSLTVGGTSTAVHKVNVKGDNGLATDRYFLGSAIIGEPLQADLREVTGSFDADFGSTTLYTNYVNGTESALVLKFEGATISGSDKFGYTFTLNVRADGETPSVGGPDIVGQTVNFKAVGSTDATAITIAQKTSESSP